VIGSQAGAWQAALAARIERVQARIAEAAGRVGRQPADVELIAVTKTVPAHIVRAAWELGLTAFGENRVQEALEKIPLVSAADVAGGGGEPQIAWHMIGHLQRNKVKWVVPRFALIHSVDSLRLAQEIDKRAAAAGRRMPILLEVNVGGEESKFGFTPDELMERAAYVAELPNVDIRGLMTVAPLMEDPEAVRPYFACLRRQRDQLQSALPSIEWRHLSMGMTDDFEIAIEEGATLVRVGRAIFGERQE
jgi:pyridoxal phosphate enzyme (YggS family)